MASPGACDSVLEVVCGGADASRRPSFRVVTRCAAILGARGLDGGGGRSWCRSLRRRGDATRGGGGRPHLWQWGGIVV